MAGKRLNGKAKRAADARRAERRAVRERVRVGDVAAATGATRERAAKAPAKGATWHGRNEATARIGSDLPKAVREMFARGLLERPHVKAAETYIALYQFGVCQPGMTQKWEKGVDGGRGGGEAAEARIVAKQDWEMADRALGAMRAVVFGVLLGGVTLDAVDGPGRSYQAAGSRRAANGSALYLGLDMLARLWLLKDPG